MKEVRLTRVDIAQRKAMKITDYVAQEKPLHIFIGKTLYVTIFCSPSNLKELAFGHLLTEGIVKSAEEIEEAILQDEPGICRVKLKPSISIKKRLKFSKPFSRLILSACGSKQPYQFSGRLPKVKSRLAVRAEIVIGSVSRLNSIATTFRKTGAVHVAAIYKLDGSLVAFAEDVGRHNAVDKAIGVSALNRVDFGGCFLALSGRLSADIVLKAARVGLPIVASLAAALDSGIVIAKDSGLTLVGFARGKRMNIYTFSERILA